MHNQNDWAVSYDYVEEIQSVTEIDQYSATPSLKKGNISDIFNFK